MATDWRAPRSTRPWFPIFGFALQFVGNLIPVCRYVLST
jgi:hypothetical protein